MEQWPITLDGKRVKLEPMTDEHCEALFNAAQDGQLWLSRVTVVPCSLDQTGVYIQEALEGQSRGQYAPFVIYDKFAAKIVGTTRYRAIDRSNRRLEIGSTWLSVGAQQTPVNTEAKYLLLTNAFDNLDCRRVEFLTDVINQQSRRAIVRLGAQFEGILRCHMVRPDGSSRNSACYSICESEWPEVKSHLETLMVYSK